MNQGPRPLAHPIRQVIILLAALMIFQNVYVSKCSASIQIPHIQTVLTKHIKVAALGHKCDSLIMVSCKATCYLYFSLLNLTISFSTLLESL